MAHDGSVIIALDGSAHSAQTLEWGMAEAARRGAEAVLVRACPGTREINVIGWYPLLEDEMFEAESRSYLEHTLPRVRERWPGVTVSTRLLHGSEVPVLRDVSRGAGLLVVGARGHSGRRRLGSTGSHVTAHALCPVAVVRDAQAGAEDGAPVVVGVDGSVPSVAAARVAAHEASLRGTPLVVVHARPTRLGRHGDGETAAGSDTSSDADGSSDTAGADDKVGQLARELTEAHPGLEVSVDVRFDDPPRALLEAGKGAGLIVVGSRGLGAFRGLLMGSVSSEVVRKADQTVLVVRAGVDDEAGSGHVEGTDSASPGAAS
ncbi:universal stress protein [Sanguibacter sp. 25GB23B1]|uniref:universal stress protein n=1 Tax=unclassified Sanguibacter TaxID=2645534 RepID=UPI0032AF1829